MSQYYNLWISSEAARDRILLILAGVMVVQVAGYYLLPLLLQSKLLRKARFVLVVLCIVQDLVISLSVGLALK